MKGGSKTIARVGQIMRVIEHGPEEGMSAVQIANAAGFDKATTYRALIAMEHAGLVDRDSVARRYRLGIYLFSLGAKTARRFSILNRARQALVTLAEDIGDTISLSVRNKYDAVCIDTLSGSYPIKAQTLGIGDSVPLGISAAGVAMLATMDNDDVRHALQYNAIAIGRFQRVRPDEIFSHVEQCRAQGYARYSGQIIAGMGSIAHVIRNAAGQGVAALSVVATLDRLTDQRIPLIADVLAGHITDIEKNNFAFNPG